MNFIAKTISKHTMDEGAYKPSEMDAATRKTKIKWSSIKALAITMLVPLLIIFIPYGIGIWNIMELPMGDDPIMVKMWLGGLLQTLCGTAFISITAFCCWGLKKLYHNLEKEFDDD